LSRGGENDDAVEARAIGNAAKEIKIRHTGNCLKADPAYGKGVADALGIPLSKVPTSAESHPRIEAQMSQGERAKARSI
jgi:hypothetical protein